MKRHLFVAALFVLICTSFAPSASAMPGDCFDTCDISSPCGSQTCQDCIREWDTDECMEWREAECQWYGLCGQCEVIRTYHTDTASGNWQFSRYVCYDPAYTGPNEQKAEYARLVTRRYYKVTRCNGVDTTTQTGSQTYYTICWKHYGGGCFSGPTVTYSNYSCPF